MRAEFRIEEGDLSGLVLALEEKQQWLIGRDPEKCDLLLEDPDIDRVQLRCELAQERYYIENLSKTRVVTLNGELLNAKKPLVTGDRLAIGRTVLLFLELEAPKAGIVFSHAKTTAPKTRAEKSLLETFNALSENELNEHPVEEEVNQQTTSDNSDLQEQDLPETEEPATSEESEIAEEKVAPQLQAKESEAQEEESIEDEQELEEKNSTGSEENDTTEQEGSAKLEPEESEAQEEEESVEDEQELEEKNSTTSEENDTTEQEKLLKLEPEEPNPLEGEGPAENADPMPLFEPSEAFNIDLTPTSRFTLKVIAGPNTGAEFSIDIGKEYLIGTDTTTCDIIFHDLSVSREHARLGISAEGEISVEDLDSRNGVIVDQLRIKEKILISSHSIITIGTTSFFIIDKEAPQETIVTPLLEPIDEEEEEESLEEQWAEEEEEEEAEQASSHTSGAFVFSFILIGFIVLVGYGVFSLSQSKDATAQVQVKDESLVVQEALKEFSGVRYTYNRATKQLFLVGHVMTSIEYSELLYNLQALTFVRGVQNNVVNDEAIWQEMNLLFAKRPDFKGVSMHTPSPGVFVLSGYLKTDAQASDLMDFVNLNFNYLNLLENRVVVEQEVAEEIATQLMQQGFGAVSSNFINGDATLTGYIGAGQTQEFEGFVKKIEQIPGVRHVLNYVVVVTPEQQVIDLSQRFPGRYVITGYSKHGDVNVNVVINGKILMRGDTIGDMTITSIQPNTIFLEKDGLKYKIEYNK